MTTKLTTRLAMAAGATLLLTGTAFAQSAPEPKAAHAGPHRGERMKMRHNPEARAQHLRDVLQLRSDQEPALKTFLASAKPQMRGERPNREALKDETTPQRLDRQAARMAQHQQAFQRRAAATKTFYAALTPTQQKAFDALHEGRGERGKGKGQNRMKRMGPPPAPPQA
ncbi:Spy/CpxP family protein refolding chaperone [Caulobacter sp. NIBR2454]|uniref:Spy/CpxP family protein refolding chaperone n=1 Tax=Caulobacter sp. NIBR2454 TaxID=3015996 RepID=UPI0022B6F0EA|nr:Spy/CpxP family protein refolding chaperone [Caulobacter sp. NIBR2454]